MQEWIHGGDIYHQKITVDASVNVNPYGIPDAVRAALIQAVDHVSEYPDINCDALRASIAEFASVSKEQIICGNGASELFLAIARSVMPEQVLVTAPSFYGYAYAAAAVGAKLCEVPLREEQGFRVNEEILSYLTEDLGLCFLACPNNPTGQLIEWELLEKIVKQCEKHQIVLVLDECFLMLTAEGERYDRRLREMESPYLIRVSAFTKMFAMPGVRLGYLTGQNQALLGQIRQQLPEWNLSVFAQRAGVAASYEREFVRTSMERIDAERNDLAGRLRELGIQVYDSQTNFLLLRSEVPLYDLLMTQGILIRDCSNYSGLSRGYYRVAVKQHQENLRLIEGIEYAKRTYTD